MKPLIGIIGRPELSTGKNPIMGIYSNIIKAVTLSKGIPIGILTPEIQPFFEKNINNTQKISSEQFNDLKATINLCDGIICQGGDNFYDYDLKIIKYCYDNNIPLLGICLGMQTIGKLFNGSLKKIDNHYNNFHNVKLIKDSTLYKIIKKEYIQVNSRHKYCLKTTNLKISSSINNIIESIEDNKKDFFIGVQWHPETYIETDENSQKLFNYFIKICNKRNENN